MNREVEQTEELIDLGAASTETRGGVIPAPEDEKGFLPGAGISDD
jgi:hypothetical protein